MHYNCSLEEQRKANNFIISKEQQCSCNHDQRAQVNKNTKNMRPSPGAPQHTRDTPAAPRGLHSDSLNKAANIGPASSLCTARTLEYT